MRRYKSLNKHNDTKLTLLLMIGRRSSWKSGLALIGGLCLAGELEEEGTDDTSKLSSGSKAKLLDFFTGVEEAI